MSSKTIDCPLCGTGTDLLLSNSLRRGNGEVFYCNSCDLGFLKNREFDAVEYYKNEYRDHVSHRSEASPTSPKEIFDIYENKQDQRLPYVLPHLNSETNFLELGASAGQFLHHIKDKCSSVSAIELDVASKEHLDTMHGVQTSGEPLINSSFYKNDFDVICAFQVLEHIPDPKDFLEQIYESLNHKGLAFIEVPNLSDPLISVWNIPEYKDFFYHEDHLYYFSEKSLTKYAVSAGFDKSKIEFYFTQDYNLLNHLNWITNRTPQATCEPGLSKIEISNSISNISSWLSSKLVELNNEYSEKLSTAKSTSNILMKLAK